MAIKNLLFANRDVPNIENIDVYEAHGGYKGLKNAVAMDRSAIMDEMKTSGLRGRGGAGFPFVRIADEVMRFIKVLWQATPLDPCWEPCTAPTAKS